MKKLLSLTLAAVMLIAAVAASVPALAGSDASFTDVAADRWSYSSVIYAVGKGYMVGTAKDRFSPENPLTRAMIATVLWRREGSPKPKASSGFEDVADGAWYADAVAWAKENGVVNGVSKTRFAPDTNVTREQLATMLYRFSQSGPVFVTDRADITTFNDFSEVSDWATDALGWAVEAGLVKGVSGNRLSPGGNATREQFAAIIERYDGKFVLVYSEPVLLSSYTEKEYPLVKNADFYVSTTGSDSSDGSFAHPFKTINKAAEAVRGIEKTAEKGGVTVAFMAGNYGAISLGLTAADSGTAECPVTYCAYGDGDVIFDGGFDVTEDEFLPVTGDDKAYFADRFVGDIKKADISAKLENYDPASLMVMGGDGECTLARYPNKYEDGTDNLMNGAGYTIDDNHIRITMSLLKRRIAKYHKPEELYLYGYLSTGWYKDLLETGGYTVDPETEHYDFVITHPENARMGHLRYLELDGFDSAFWNKTALINASEELDAQGEYWIDSDTGTFYVYSPSGEYHFTGGSDMITMNGTEYTTFRKLNFKNADGCMIDASGHPRGLTIDECTFTGCTAESMVNVAGGKTSVPYDVTVKNSTFSTAAATGLKIRGTNSADKFGTGTGVVVDNNYFTLTNLRIGNMGALKVEVEGPLVTHNIFKKCYWEGVDFRGASDMIAEYNVFDEVCYNGDDTGAMNNWNSVDCCGNIVRYNLFMNIRGGTNGRNSLYLDDTAGTRVESNIFYNVDSTVMNNGISKYNTFKDNIIINPESRSGTGCSYKIDATERTEEAMATGNLEIITADGFYTRWQDAFAYFDSHPEIKAQAAERWPGYFDISLDLEDWQSSSFCMNSSLEITGNVEINLTGEAPKYNETISKYSTIENNVTYTSEENPLFVNPSAGDYTLRDGVAFPFIDFAKIGRY